MAQLDDIISGKGTYKHFKFQDGTRYSAKELADLIICADGTELSVQASKTHYCTPRADRVVYSRVEVGYPSVDPPESWAEYADGEYPSSVYGCVPVELVREFIEAHGGEQPAPRRGRGGVMDNQAIALELCVYQVKLLEHVRLEGLQHRLNEWLKGYNWAIQRVISVSVNKPGSFYVATVLYSEQAD